MERFELKKYDPFPLNVGESRTVDGFTFSFNYGKLKYNTFSGLPGDDLCYYFSVKCEEELCSSAINVWDIEPNQHLSEPLQFIQTIMVKRKLYTLSNVLWAFQTHSKDQNRKKVVQGRTYTQIQYSYNRSMAFPWDDWNVKLKAALEKDFKAWKSERKAFKKSLPAGDNDLANHRSDLEDTIRTKDLMECLPWLADLESVLSVLMGKGETYSKIDVSDVSKMIDSMRRKSIFKKLRKHGI